MPQKCFDAVLYALAAIGLATLLRAAQTAPADAAGGCTKIGRDRAVAAPAGPAGQAVAPR